MAADPAKLAILDVEEALLKTVFAGEAAVFTPWLARQENLSRLGRVVGLDLEPVATEESTGRFRIDLVARNIEDGSLVIVENQFGSSDHDHLGKALTYLAATAEKQARTVIWLAEKFADEHRAVLTWLNDNTPEDVSFFGVTPKLLRIGDGPPGLRFEVPVAPNRVVKAARASSERAYDPSVLEMRAAYWPVFQRALHADPMMQNVVTKFGGRLGFMHLFPDRRFLGLVPSVHCLAYLQVPASGSYRTGVWFRPNSEQAEHWRDKIEAMRRDVEHRFAEYDRQFSETVPFTRNAELEAVAREHLSRVKLCLEAVRQAFEPEVREAASAD